MAFGRRTDTRSDGVIDSCTVTYKGGLRDLPKAKLGKITLEVLEDRFRLTAGNDVARKFWADLELPYSIVSSVEVADRTVSTFEGIAGGLNSRQLNQKNNIHFAFRGTDGPVVLRVEMLTGVTVMGQARRCQEFEDRLRSHQIWDRFGGAAAMPVPGRDATQPADPWSAADELAKLASLRDRGVLSDQEFQAQKAKILG